MEINHVLIVEDDKEIREGVQIYLQSQGLYSGMLQVLSRVLRD